MSLAQLDTTTMFKQVYLGEVIAYPTAIEQGDDFKVRAGAG